MSFYLVQFLTGLASASSLFLVSAGLSLIFGVTRIVNFAHGSFYMMGAYLAFSAATALGGSVGSFWIAVAVAAFGVALFGIVMEVLLLRRIYHAPELFQLIATFGVVLLVKDGTRLIWGNDDYVWPRPPTFAAAIEIGTSRLPVYDLVLIAAGPVVLIAMWILLRRTRWGTLVRAATQDRDMVGALGVNQKLLFTSVLFAGAFLAGLGGALQLPREAVTLTMDFNIIAAAFVVVVVGGMGSIPGAYLAAFIIAELNAFGILIFPKITLVLMFLVMAVVLMVRPWGLLGSPDAGMGAAAQVEPPLRPAEPRLKLLYALLFGVFLALPLLGQGTLILAIDILIVTLFAASLHFILGPAGLHSFGHAAYFGLGAYGAALLVNAPGPALPALKLSMEFALFAGVGAAVLGALIIGWFVVRLSGIYLAMLTMAFAQIVWSIMYQWSDLTGGENGILGVRVSAWAASKTVYYYVVLALTVASLAILRRMLFAPFGFALRAGRDSPRRADAIGIDVKRTQWFGFAVAGGFAGLAGILHLYAKGNVFPTILEIPHSIDAIMMVMLGGVQTLGGPLVGAAAFTWLNDIMSNPKYWAPLGAAWVANYWQGSLGIVIIVIVLAFPLGIGGFLRDRLGVVLGLVRREELIGSDKG
jgi:branched-chain amino acid transport system permease protein